MLLYIGEKNVLAFRSSVMEELEAVENYLLRGAYPSGLSKGEKANLRRKCKNNFKLEDGILYYKRAVADGESKEAKSDRVLPCWSRRQVQIASIGNKAIKVEGSVPVYSLPNVLT